MSGIIGGQFAKDVVQKLQDVAKARGKSVGDQWGTPLNGRAPTRDQTVQLWNYQNPNVDPRTVQSLVAAGQHAQAVQYVYPYRMALVGQGDTKTRVDRATQISGWAQEASMPPEVG